MNQPLKPGAFRRLIGRNSSDSASGEHITPQCHAPKSLMSRYQPAGAVNVASAVRAARCRAI